MNFMLRPRPWFFFVTLACAGMLTYALYVQHFDFIDPCPLCVLQRMAYMWIGAAALLGGMFSEISQRQVSCVPAGESKFIMVDFEVAETVWGWYKDGADLAAIVGMLVDEAIELEPGDRDLLQLQERVASETALADSYGTQMKPVKGDARLYAANAYHLLEA